MKYKVQFIPEAKDDYNNLDGSEKRVVNKKIDELESNPFLGHKLWKEIRKEVRNFV